VSGQIVPAKEKYTVIKNFLGGKDSMAAIERALPSHIDPGKMLQVVLTAITKQPKLLECKPATIAKAVLESSQLGLMPDGVLGHGYMVPYGTNCTFIPGYKGLIELARRSGKVDSIFARAVYEGDEFDYEYGLEPKLTHKDSRLLGNEKGQLVAVYAVARLKDAEPAFDVMHKEDVEKNRKRSPASTSGPWVTDYDEMAKKTVLRRLCKYLPLSTEVTAAVTKMEYAERGLLDRLNLETEPVVPIEPAGAIDSLLTEDEDDVVIDIDPETGEILGDSERGEPQFEGKGKISSEEDDKFINAISALAVRANDIGKGDTFSATLKRQIGGMGCEQLSEIRKRSDRESLYKEMAYFVSEWEKAEEH